MPLLLLLLFLIPNPAPFSHAASVASESQPVKMVISERCVSDPNAIEGQEIDLTPGSPLILTHRIRLVPSSGSDSCCPSEFAAVRERLEALEREVSELREKCGGLDGGCCTSQQSQGAGCSTVRPPSDQCLNDCSDQGRCVDGKCVCFAGFTGPDCSVPDCPGDCNKKGKCVDGKCVCDPGFAGPDCSLKTCPKNCSNNGRCVNGKCMCNAGFTGPDCSTLQCPGNCNNKGRCVNGKCVCVAGFTGPDCSEKSCPGNCNHKGRCVNGKCECVAGFVGPDCSEKSCPGNCNNKGRCVDGKCVCDEGFTGPDCSEKICPGNCNNKGRCVDGKCVCNPGFVGLDCSERSCPGNCNDKGRCVDGKCVCVAGFTGLDCSEKSCPNNCNNKGRCVNGKCVCDAGFTGPDCSEKSCPGNCNNKGKCVNGKCVCDAGFTGPDCSTKTCPNSCSSKGRCVNGRCVCEVGFSGLDCSTKTCLNNCSNRGRCVNGKCVCNPGFAEPDCSECSEGFAGPDCATALIAVSQISARNITESSVTLFWTPPPVQYNTYHITFTSQKESDQISEKVKGGFSSYTQVGLAPGQRYTATIVGEKDGKLGAESTTTFQTLISGPKNLHVVKTSTTSVIVQWEEAQGQIDRYILSTAPHQSDASAEGRQEKRLPPGIDSAQIDGLQPGRLYDISLVAVKDGIQSLPASVGATPGVNAELPDPASRNTRGSDGILSNLRLQNVTKGSSSQYQSGKDPSREQESLWNSVEPTVMTERNLTAYGINGTKLVRRVLIRQKILHLNRETNGKALTGNMLGHDIFTNNSDRTEGSSDEIEPLHGKGPKLQEGGFQENPIPEELQKKTLTTPSPSHPQLMTHTQPSLVPSNTRDQPTNNLQTPPGDRYRPKPSHQLPPSSNYRYLGSSTSLINSRHQTPPVSSTGSSQIQEGNNVSSLQSSHPPKVDKDSSKQKTTDLKEPVEGHSKGSSGSSLPEETTDTKNTNEATFSKHGETINKTLPLYNRMPFRAPFPRRPNIGPVQNRTSGYQSVRSPKHRPFPPRINNTAINKVQPGITSRNQRVLNHNRPPIFPGQGRNGTIIRLPPKIKTNPQNGNVSTSSETNLKFPADTGADLKSVLAFSTGKSPSKNNDTILSVRGSSEITIDHILPNSTTNHQRIPGVFNNRQHASNRQILLKRRNNTGIRLPSGFAVRGLTHLENSNYKTGHKDTSKDRNTEPSANMPFPTEAPITNTDAFKGLIQRSENAIDLINKEHLPRNHELSKIITGEHEHPMLSNINTTLPLLINQNPDSESRGQRENAQNQNRNKLIVRRKDGTLVRLRPKRPNQIKPNIPIFHSESVILPTTKPESPYKTQAGAADLNISNQNILPRITDRDQNLSGTPSRDPDLSRITERDPDLSGTPSKDPDLSIITDRDPDWSGATSRDQNLSGTPSQDPDLSRITDRDPDLSGTPSREKDLMRITDRGNSLRWITDKDQDLPSTTMEPVPPKIMKENAPHPKLGPKYTQRRNGTFHPELRVDTEESGLKDKDAGVEKGSKETRVFFYQTAGAEDNTDNISQRVINRNNSTAVEPESNSPKGPNFTATFTTSRKHGALLRPALNTQTRPNITPQRKISTNTRLPPKPRPDTSSKNFTHHLKLGWSTEVPLSPEPTENTLPVYQVSEDGINQINVQNVTSYGFVIIWAAPEGRFKNFVIAVTEENDGEDDGSKQDVETKRDGRNITTNVMDVRGNSSSSSSSIGIRQNSIVSLPGSARSYPVSDLSAHTGYSVTLYTTSPGSKTHTFIVTTGPEPPSHLSFSDITDSSLSVSWRRPKSSVSGFKVTYIHTKEGEPISVSVDSGISTLSLSKLSPGSTYEVAVISVLGLDESDPIKDFVITLPDPPTDLRAINITDTKALLLWRPALATADQYIITYHTDEASGANTSVKVSGNAVEQQLQALKASTKYRVTIFSRLGDQKSSSTHTSFTTASGSPGKGEPPRDLKAKPVTARTALLSWKPPSSPVTSYKLTYFIKGGERKEVTLNPGVSEHKLRGLRPSSLYTALLQGERGGVYTSSISTEFTTVTLRFPFPSDCSQELLNGEKDSGLVEIFPGGKEGRPVMVYCDMETDEGGWTVFQRRKDGKTKFFRSWQEYRKGFGDLEGEFWLGNDALHNLTLMTPMTMRVDLRTQNESVYARYASFSMDTLRKHYMLQVSGYSGTAGDSMRYHDKRPFSTHDRDPQPLITRCAMSYKGGWWYKNCHEANLNGQYGTHTNHQGVIWTAWKGTNFSIPFTEMKIRPASFKP